MKVICFGDSLTSGGGENGRFSDILQDRFPDHRFPNRGVGGETIVDGLARLESDVLDEWSYMLRAADSSRLLLYFEKAAPRQRIGGLVPGAEYLARWYDPRTGAWTSFANPKLTVGANGEIAMPPFPSGTDVAENDWAAQLTKGE